VLAARPYVVRVTQPPEQPGQHPAPPPFHPGPYSPPVYPQPGYPQAGYPQPQGYPAHGAGWPPPPAPKNNQALIITLSIVGAVLVLVCGGGALFVAVLATGIGSVATRTASTSDAMRSGARAFLDPLVAGEPSKAFKATCASVQSNYTADDLTGIVADHWPATYTITSVQATATGRGTVSATISFRSGETYSHDYPMTDESGTWRVCGEPI
jgi:hypothetical protein